LFNVECFQKFSSNGQMWPPRKPYITRFNWAWNLNFYEGQLNQKPVFNNRKPVRQKSRCGPSIKYVTLFWTNFDPPPSVTHLGTPLKYVTHLGPFPQFCTSHIHKYVFTGGLFKFAGVFVWGFVRGVFYLEGFVWGVFLSVPPLSEYIRYNRKLNTSKFRFHMYEIFYKCNITCSHMPLPLSKTVTFPDHLPLERDVLYGRPLLTSLTLRQFTHRCLIGNRTWKAGMAGFSSKLWTVFFPMPFCPLPFCLKSFCLKPFCLKPFYLYTILS